MSLLRKLATILLGLAKQSRQNGMFTTATATPYLYGPNYGQGDGGGYPRHRQAEIEVALAEAWNWLQVTGLIVPAPTTLKACGSDAHSS